MNLALSNEIVITAVICLAVCTIVKCVGNYLESLNK